MKLRSILSALMLTAGIAAAPTADAAVIMSLQEVGSDVIGTASGSADTTGFALPVLTLTSQSGVDAILGQISFGGSVARFAGVLSGPSTFGSGGLALATSVSGSAVGIDGPSDIYLPVGYVSNSALSAAMSFAGKTLADLGLTTGVYTWTWGSGANADSLTLYIGVPVPSAVPLPASLLLLATGVAAVTTLRRRKST